MFISLMIVIIVLNDFLTLVYAKQRLEYVDMSMLANKAGIKLDDKFNGILFRTGFRLFLIISILIFWLYALLFIPYLFIPIILNIITYIISLIILFFINLNNPNIELTFYKRLWVVRLDAIVSLIIWFPYFSPLLALVF